MIIRKMRYSAISFGEGGIIFIIVLDGSIVKYSTKIVLEL